MPVAMRTAIDRTHVQCCRYEVLREMTRYLIELIWTYIIFCPKALTYDVPANSNFKRSGHSAGSRVEGISQPPSASVRSQCSRKGVPVLQKIYDALQGLSNSSMHAQ